MVEQAVDLVPVKVPDGNDVLYGYSPGSFLSCIGFPALITYLSPPPIATVTTGIVIRFVIRVFRQECYYWIITHFFLTSVCMWGEFCG
jgi:hypothetical protein